MIELRNISFSYNSELILDSISFEVKEGERIVLLGVNGSGKSTLLKLIDALIFPNSGEYYFKGSKIDKKIFKNNEFSINFRKSVVMLFQNPEVMLFNPTVYDEIAFGLRQLNLQDNIDDSVRRWANILHIDKYLDLPPMELSGGEKQKVALASLLVLEPSLLLLDEPMANLDPRSQGMLLDLLYELPVTTIISTHNLSLAAELGERAILLSENHQLIYDGDVYSLLSNEQILIKANLIHKHKHKHESLYHTHYHKHL
jgi:cobalt/nickel transport system ATP-binding protein